MAYTCHLFLSFASHFRSVLKWIHLGCYNVVIVSYKIEFFKHLLNISSKFTLLNFRAALGVAFAVILFIYIIVSVSCGGMSWPKCVQRNGTNWTSKQIWIKLINHRNKSKRNSLNLETIFNEARWPLKVCKED